MRSRRVGLTIFLAVLVAGGLLGVACGGSSNNATPTPQKTAQPAATSTKAAGATTAPTKAATSATTAAAGSPTAAGTAVTQVSSVTIKDYQFTPGTVTIKVGGAVTWTNDGPSTHTVTADDGSFRSGDLRKGDTYTRTFNTAGTFDYHCTIHPSMKAQVVVEP